MKTTIIYIFMICISVAITGIEFSQSMENNQSQNAISKADDDVIVDSKLSLKEALAGSKSPKNILAQQVLLNVEYYSFDNKLHRGQIVVHQDVSDEVKEIFDSIKANKFIINKVIPIVVYNWDDDKSCNDNNTSGFNYRKVAGTKRMSNHSFGKAIDFNPIQNPYKASSGKISPVGAKYDTTAKGTFSANNKITKLFLEKGWKWGGNYKTIKDWQHFDKRL